MGKLLFFLLVFLLCLGGTLQKKGRRRDKSRSNRTAVAVAEPRTFKGEPDVATDLFPPLNGTQPPALPRAPQTLRLLSNNTVGFLLGPLSTRVIPFIYILVVAVGIPANVAILSTLASKTRKVSSAILYCSLAVSDLLLLLSLLFKAHYHFHGNHWVLGEAACRVVTACFYGNLYCSAQTLACISTKRYLAVVHPFLYKRLPKRMYTTWVTLGLWGVFGAAVVPELMVRQSYWLPEVGRVTCHDVLPLDLDSHVFLLYYDLLLAVFGLLLPLMLTAACYIQIVRELSRSHHDWTLYIKASSLVFLIFLACFTPAGVLHLLHHVQLFVDGAQTLYVHFKVATCLCCLHACLDPFLFLLMSKSSGSRLYLQPLKGKPISISVSV
ncbi:proteinase-activated receptor 3 [Brachionichthys hirsutus]|uniref:proteinase-activated receptor 3 n=1 Tax=Brachionichthys hirsutus TaxID=412623 RepID=UPI0036049404